VDGVQGAAGRLLVELAVLLERTVAGEVANERLKRRRNAALRAAYRRGVPVETLAARLGLSEAWVRRVVNGGPRAARTMDP
jgi:Mor family transcriptional regulator